MAINIHEMWYKWKTMRVHILKLIKELITGQNYIGDHFLLKINFPYIDIGTNLPFKPLSKWFSFSILLLFGKLFSCPLQRENVMIHIKKKMNVYSLNIDSTYLWYKKPPSL